MSPSNFHLVQGTTTQFLNKLLLSVNVSLFLKILLLLFFFYFTILYWFCHTSIMYLFRVFFLTLIQGVICIFSMRTKPVYMPIQKFIKVLYANCIYNKQMDIVLRVLCQSYKLLYRIGAAHTFFVYQRYLSQNTVTFFPLIIGKKYLWFL